MARLILVASIATVAATVGLVIYIVREIADIRRVVWGVG